VDFLIEYGIFLAKAITVVIAIVLVIAAAGGAAVKSKGQHKREMKVEKVNDRLTEFKETLEHAVLNKDSIKQLKKDVAAQEKADKKKAKASAKTGATLKVKPRVYVLDFKGDIKASAVEAFRDAVTSVLQVVNADKDEVVVRLESPGGMVHSYGLASAQLDRLKTAGVRLTVCVDRVAASGGYMMACVADKIVASPFAIMGSIGVVAQLPNFNKLLKKNDIDYEILTAGEYKRTLTMFGENTEKGREKFRADLEDTHELFKTYVSERRPSVDIEKVATGDIWFGSRALEVALVDELATSDEYLVSACANSDVYEVEFKEKQTLAEKVGLGVSTAFEKSVEKILSELNVSRGMK